LAALWSITVESGWFLVLGFFLAGLVHAFVPMSLIRRHLSGAGAAGSFLAIFKGAVIGAPLPLCSCSVIPAAAGLKRAGASKGATASFAVATPETGVDSISITYALLGPVMAIVRPLAAIVTAIVTGVLVHLFASGDDEPSSRGVSLPVASEPTTAKSCCQAAHVPEPVEKACCATERAGQDETAKPSLAARLRSAAVYGWVDLPKDLAVWLVVGLALSAAIAVLIPPEWLERFADSPWSLALMLLAGLPVYVCATSSTPIAAALIAQGLSPGAGLVFLLAGPASNIATMAWVLKDLGARALTVYIVVIAACSLLAGWLMNEFLPAAPIREVAQRMHEHAHSPLAILGGAAVSALLLVGVGARLRDRFARDSQGEHCDHD
ncbi:MAG: SO_0444 family Cu/Zn efflux transporter, partial [Phycisphaerales bacterium]